MLKPYYEDGVVTIYHGDCREILPSLRADVVITDPPYGVGFRGNDWDESIPVEWLAIAQQTAPLVVFTTHPTSLWDYPRPTWVGCWHRPASNGHSSIGGYNHWTPLMVYGQTKWDVDTISLHAIANASEKWVDHPTPKPIKLMRWLVSRTTVEGAMIVDPFMGSGTTLRAAKDMGRRAIGVEIDERYCELAVKRLGQETLGLSA